jgi:hypothetical protein
MTMRSALILTIVCGLGLAVTEGVATAQPWAEGVSEDQKNAAKAKLEEGNARYLKNEYKEAQALYEEALKSWNHPAIRFNLVRCLVQLEQWVPASENLDQALVHGKAPFTEEVFNEVQSYQKMLSKQTAEVELSCSQDGAKLTFNGKPFIDKCPGKQKRRVETGQHQVVATKDGFLTKEMPVIVVGGKAQSVEVELVPLDKAAKVVHKWPTWIPWTVFIGGLAVTGVGVLLEVDAQSQMNQYDQDVAGRCAVNGCNLRDPMPGTEEAAIAESLNDQKSRAESRDKLAIAIMSVGIAGAAVGGVLLFLNRGQTVYEDPVKGGATAKVNVTPTHDGGMVSLSGRF